MAKQKRLRGRAERQANLDYIQLIKNLRIPDNIPQEIRDQIAGYVCAPKIYHEKIHHEKGDFHLRANWSPNHFALPPSILHAGLAAWYGSKKLIIELPDFIPSSWDADNPCWPSAIHIHDTTYELSFWCAPPFLSQPSIAASSIHHLSLEDFERCPFWLFSSITVQIPPPSTDPASLIMNWSRLKYIGHAIHKSWDSLAQRRD